MSLALAVAPVAWVVCLSCGAPKVGAECGSPRCGSCARARRMQAARLRLAKPLVVRVAALIHTLDRCIKASGRTKAFSSIAATGPAWPTPSRLSDQIHALEMESARLADECMLLGFDLVDNGGDRRKRAAQRKDWRQT